MARAALARAKADAAGRGAVPGRRGAGGARSSGGAGRTASRARADPRSGRSGTGPGADPRDPQLFGAAIRGLLAERGWEQTSRSAAVLSDWERLVGAELAAHCRPVSLLDGELVVAAESSAWATQLRLLAPQLLARLADALGAGTVRRLRVQGPTTPSWNRGPLRVVGRGPRDTYG